MKTMIKFPKIQQFRQVVKDINHAISYVGVDKNGNPIYNQAIPKPVITFSGSVKLHGTNASVCYNTLDGFWVQSRQNIITIDNDNYEFAAFAESNKGVFMKLIDIIKSKHQIDTQKFTIAIYGEWAGKGIQKGVGVSKLEKAFYIFGVKVANPKDANFKSYWLPIDGLMDTKNQIYNITSFKTFEIAIDFNIPEMVQNKLAEITTEVEKSCPVAKALGENGLGEGVVWTTNFKGNNYRFKVKGEKHSVSKVKKLASVNVEKLKTINDFVNYAVTENRFKQAMEITFGKTEINIKKMGDVIRWMVKDIMAEEMDTMEENGLTPKDINKYISLKTRMLFFETYNKL